MIEELLESFVCEIDAELFEAVVVEDLKAGYVKDANEKGTLRLHV
jgi:hypothetical protein